MGQNQFFFYFLQKNALFLKNSMLYDLYPFIKIDVESGAESPAFLLKKRGKNAKETPPARYVGTGCKQAGL